MVTLPPLSEGAYSQLRAALEVRAAQMELNIASASSVEVVDYCTSALFWINDAILTIASAETMPEYPADATWTAA